MGEAVTTSGLPEAVTTAMASAGSSALEYVTTGVTAVLPSAASIMALLLGVRLAFGFFKSIAN